MVSVLRTSINVLSKSKSRNYVTWIPNLTKLFLSVFLHLYYCNSNIVNLNLFQSQAFTKTNKKNVNQFYIHLSKTNSVKVKHVFRNDISPTKLKSFHKRTFKLFTRKKNYSYNKTNVAFVSVIRKVIMYQFRRG